MGNDAGGVILLFLFIGLYFLPTIVAGSSHKRNTGAIFVLNLLLGWTVVGWIIAIVWASTTDVQPVTVIQQTAPPAVQQLPAAFCTKCGVYSPPGSAFCNRCGGGLGETQ
jgi:hypothetical protein